MIAGLFRLLWLLLIGYVLWRIGRGVAKAVFIPADEDGKPPETRLPDDGNVDGDDDSGRKDIPLVECPVCKAYVPADGGVSCAVENCPHKAPPHS